MGVWARSPEHSSWERPWRRGNGHTIGKGGGCEIPVTERGVGIADSRAGDGRRWPPPESVLRPPGRVLRGGDQHMLTASAQEDVRWLPTLPSSRSCFCHLPLPLTISQYIQGSPARPVWARRRGMEERRWQAASPGQETRHWDHYATESPLPARAAQGPEPPGLYCLVRCCVGIAPLKEGTPRAPRHALGKNLVDEGVPTHLDGSVATRSAPAKTAPQRRSIAHRPGQRLARGGSADKPR